MVFSHVHATDRLFGGWDLQAISRIPIEYDMAEHACTVCVVQYPAFTTVHGEWFVGWYESRTFLSIRVYWVVSMV